MPPGMRAEATRFGHLVATKSCPDCRGFAPEKKRNHVHVDVRVIWQIVEILNLVRVRHFVLSLL